MLFLLVIKAANFLINDQLKKDKEKDLLQPSNIFLLMKILSKLIYSYGALLGSTNLTPKIFKNNRIASKCAKFKMTLNIKV